MRVSVYCQVMTLLTHIWDVSSTVTYRGCSVQPFKCLGIILKLTIVISFHILHNSSLNNYPTILHNRD